MGKFYIFNSRVLTHVVFWVGYFLLFGFIWAKNGNYYHAYFLEFVLLPIRMLAVYTMIYWLIPRYLRESRYKEFILGTIILLLAAGLMQRVFMYFFYESFNGTENLPLLHAGAIGRSIILINSTVLFVSALKIIQLWQIDRAENELLRKKNNSQVIEIKSDKRTYRVPLNEIQYLESKGNYVIYHLTGRNLISYTSLSEAMESLPENFTRIHKSYVINKDFVLSYNHEDIQLADQIIPIGRMYKLAAR